MFSMNPEVFDLERARQLQANVAEFELKFDPSNLIEEVGQDLWNCYCRKEISGGDARRLEKVLEASLDWPLEELYIHLDEIQEFVASRNKRNYRLVYGR